ITNVLLVERLLGLARLILVSRPEARRIRRQHFVGQHDAGSGAAKFKFGVGYDQALFASVIGGLVINGKGKITKLNAQLLSDQLRHVIERYVFVVTACGLRRRRKNWFR